MYANRVIVEVVGKGRYPVVTDKILSCPQTLVEVHDGLWRKIGRKPAVCLLSGGTARVIFQEGRRVTDTLDSLQDLVRIALEREEIKQ